MKEQATSYLFLVTSVTLAIVSVLTFNIVVICAASFALLMSAIVLRMWDILDSFVFRHTNLIQLFNGFELSGDRRSAVRKSNGMAFATAVAALRIAGDGELGRDKIESIIARTEYPFKFTMQVERLNITKLLDRLNTRRNIIDIELARLDPKSQKHMQRQARLKREMEQIDNDIKNITTGEMPLKLVYYLATTAASESTYDAEERARSQIRELSSKFDALLGSKSEMVSGDELLAVMRIDSGMAMQ